MTNTELEARFSLLVQKERLLTQEILGLIREIHRRRLFAERGYPNIYDYLVRGFGYSHAAAHRRIQAAKLIESVPEAKEKLASGELNLTTMAQLQTAIHQEEKRAGTKVTQEQKQDLTSRIEGKSSRETEQILRAEFPEQKPARESLRAIDENNSRLTLILEKEAVEALERVKELLSHACPGASYAELIQRLAMEFLKRKDPLLKKENAKGAKNAEEKSAPDKQCSNKVSAAKKGTVLRGASGGCEFRDPKTGKVCGSKIRIEIDHRVPRALGGGNELSNLRCLCKSHNLLAAEQVFGAEKMSVFRAQDG